MNYEMPDMTPAEHHIYQRLTERERFDVYYGGWDAVWDTLSGQEKAELISDFELYGDRKDGE